MADLIEALRLRARGGDKLLEEAAAALEAAREDACVALVADIRFACGDNGKRMQPELVEFIRELAEDAERYRWLRDNCEATADEYGTAGQLYFGTYQAGQLAAAIDAAMQPAKGEEAKE